MLYLKVPDVSDIVISHYFSLSLFLPPPPASLPLSLSLSLSLSDKSLL